MKKISILLIIVMLCSMVGCSAKIKSEDLMKDKKLGVVSDTKETAEANVALTDFGIRLFQESLDCEKNTLISPISVVYALAMTANGAKGETLEQMEAVLGMSVEELNPYLYHYQKNLPQNKKYEMNLANSIWFTDDEKFHVEDDFLQLNADYYSADIYKTAFDEQTVKDINNWVKQNTKDMIPKILEEIPEHAVMYLVNTLAFEAEWQSIYYKQQVREGEFTCADGTKQQVEFMYGSEHTYLEDENTIGFLKYYKDQEYAFVALLPKENMNIADYIAGLDGGQINHLIENRIEGTVEVSIPKFETEFEIEMKDVLENMGMPIAFDDKAADFSGLGTWTDGNIYINQVLHKTFISVAEKGTKAGAATLVEMDGESSARDPKEVYLNRPFVYMLIDCRTNIPFFIGTTVQVND